MVERGVVLSIILKGRADRIPTAFMAVDSVGRCGDWREVADVSSSEKIVDPPAKEPRLGKHNQALGKTTTQHSETASNT